MDPALRNPTLIFAAVLVVLIIFAGVVLFARKARKSAADLLTDIGPQHGGVVLPYRSGRKAQAKLADYDRRVEGLKLRELGAAEREHFLAGWRKLQSRFVDHPKEAIAEAEDLVTSLLQTRGYPASDFRQRAADVSVSHPQLVEYYRSAHGVAARLATDAVSTQDLRAAMVQYRWLFEELVRAPTPGPI
ncbi:MAG: hypothetical protein ACLGXA_09300 [Acidobacteriota bacterium]